MLGFRVNMGASIVKTGFGVPVYYNYNKEPPKIVLIITQAPILNPYNSPYSSPYRRF